jgi:hypothetical protein
MGKSFEKFFYEFLFNCDKCGNVREAVEFNNVQEKQKNGVREMMDAMESTSLSDDDALFIVFCDNCNEYSTMCLSVDDK